jgi:hypothetical protein
MALGIGQLRRATRLNGGSEAWQQLASAYALTGDTEATRYASIRSKKHATKPFYKLLDSRTTTNGVKFTSFSERSPLWFVNIGFDSYWRNLAIAQRIQRYGQTFYPSAQNGVAASPIVIQQYQYYLRGTYRLSPEWAITGAGQAVFAQFDTTRLWGWLWYMEATRHSVYGWLGAYISKSYLNNFYQQQAGLRLGIKPFGDARLVLQSHIAAQQPDLSTDTTHFFVDVSVAAKLHRRVSVGLGGTIGQLENAHDRQAEDLYNSLDITENKAVAWVSLVATSHLVAVLIGSYEQKQDFFYKQSYDQYGVMFSLIWSP